MPDRPDRPLVVKCSFDRSSKKISFASARNCSYQLLRNKVEQCFSLSATSYVISYKDDDGEITEITTDGDLTEAIQYFQVGGDDLPQSSAASILSGRSFGSKRITLRVNITVDYDGRLSDTSSLVSIEEYEGRNSSQASLSVGSFSSDVDDDSKTVSSGDTGVNPSITFSSSPSQGAISEENELPTSMLHAWGAGDLISDQYQSSVDVRFPEDPSAVFERLKMEEANPEYTFGQGHVLGRDNERGAAWIRDQNNRAIISMLGALPEPSEIGGISLAAEENPGSQLDAGLALKRGPSGKYYYSYTSTASSAASQPSFEDPHIFDDVHAQTEHSGYKDLEPSFSLLRNPHHSSNSDPLSSRPHSKPEFDIPDEVLKFLTLGEITAPPADILTDCSECGVPLGNIRYVCSTCGEKPPMSQRNGASGKGKNGASVGDDFLSYPPPRHRSSLPSTHPRNAFFSSLPPPDHRHKPLPSLPPISGSFSSEATFATAERSRSGLPRVIGGFELCNSCIGTAGVNHALEVNFDSSSALTTTRSPSSSEDAQRARRRAAPMQKGQLRHGYVEKLWGSHGWEDVVQDDCATCRCSTCNSLMVKERYKCALCPLVLCRACYSQVHEIHPAHPFLVMPDKQVRFRSEPELMPAVPLMGHEERTLKHPDVKCAHCMLDIIGARFHCAVCESIDICSNCESAGLPGNLDSHDGGHNSSHIMIKIPYPLGFNEVQAVSRRAQRLWTARDERTVHHGAGPPSRPNSVHSHARTIVGPGSRLPVDPSLILSIPGNHGLYCNGCNTLITGTRYQCANCLSLPAPYSLCEACEERSYLIHDAMHAFFKLPRPVKRPIESAFPMLPNLYKMPVGPPPGFSNSSEPKAYLRNVIHSAAFCDLCMSRIQGAWFRCVYCGKDLCDHCEKLDTHDDSHVFLVLKSAVDMKVFRMFTPTENPHQNPPLLPYPVY